MNTDTNLSELRKKLIETIDTLQEILDIADQVDTDTAKMEEYNEPDFVDRLITDSIKSDSVDKPKNSKYPRHWASTLPDSVWERFREDAIATGDAH